MSRPDATASAALDAAIIRPVFFGFLDFLGDPLRVNTSGTTITVTGSGKPDLDGYTWDGLSAQVVDISPVRMKSGGSDAITAKLSGLVNLDDELLEIVGNPANWQGRVAQLWRMIRDATGAQQGAIQHYFTGYMTSVGITGSPQSQTIEVTIESYLVAFSSASNRSYLDQERYDLGDMSAKAAIAIANGISGSPLTSNTGTSGGGLWGLSDYYAQEAQKW